MPSYYNRDGQEGRRSQVQSAAHRPLRYPTPKPGVGKTSLLMKFVSGKFSYDYQVTTGIEFFSREVELNEKTSVNLQLWDTVGVVGGRWARRPSSPS